MDPVSQQQIIDAFRGATKSEVKRVTFPADFDDIDFGKLEFLGWRDKKIPRRAYVSVPTGDGLVTILLTQAEAKPKAKAMCTWCRDVNISSQAVLYTVRRGGPAGRKGDTIGVLVCEDFSCAANARKLPPAFHKGTDTELIREQNLADLRRRVNGFVAEVLSTED
ncbi:MULTISPECIES: FBP domain-containing protein [Tsukamurella]|uniref:FBP domain-containing protein n=2 Tax=Tsukamurella TaxID=2060 RepID=A0A5C5S3J8_9ACTN|nr:MULTISPECIES: FBP domain-containing protein [Tsukamurella]NMD56772.1 FBP domain-containing protein [Tsukamurella columbiensis]TWS29684.1 FBP domain-containing protein [Tsukamurella conjunctivitidis]